MTIEGMGRESTTENKNGERDMPNHLVHAGNEEGKNQRSCEEIREEYSWESWNHM